MRKFCAIIFSLLFLSTYALAAVSVQDIINRQDQTNQKLDQQIASFEKFKTDLNDRINAIKISEVVSFALIYISLNCFAYLFKVAWNYRRREKIMRERDKFVEQLKISNQLMSERISLMEKSQTILEKELLERLTPKSKPMPQWFSPLGGLIIITGAVLAYFDLPDYGLFLCGIGTPMAVLGVIYLDRKPKKENKTILDKVEEEIKEDSNIPEVVKEEV